MRGGPRARRARQCERPLSHEGPMTHRVTPRALSLLAVFTAAACGSGRLVPADTAEPAGAGAPSEPAVATPAPGTTTEPAPVAPNAPADPNASGYAPAGDTTKGAPAPTTTPSPAPTNAPAAASGVLALRRIGQWSTSGVTAPARLIIRDDSAYAQFWTGLGPGAGARPSVDFTRDVVIAVAAGQQSSGGHTIAVQQVTRVGDGLAVQVIETTPAEGCNTAQALTQPVDVVVVDGATAKTWSFSETKQARSC